MDGASEIRDSRLMGAVRLRCLQRDVDPDLGAALFDRSRAVFDQDGRPLNAYELVDELLERKPTLAGSLTAAEEAQAERRRQAAASETYAASCRAMSERIRRVAR